MRKNYAQFQKATYLNKEQNQIFETRKKELGYPNNAEFLRAVIAVGLSHVQKFQPSSPFQYVQKTNLQENSD